MAYCVPGDLLHGDIPLASVYGDGSGMVNMAADEIDSQLGHLYITPIVLPEATAEEVAASRPAKLLLKRINRLLASGRLILDMAVGGEDDRLHSYGQRMLDEALGLLKQIQEGKILLAGAPLLADTADDENDTISISNEDPYSLVQGFYERYSAPVATSPYSRPAMQPYDTEVV